MTTEPRRLPKDIEETLAIWISHKFRWWRTHYILGISGLLCSVTVASRPQLADLFKAAPIVLNILAWASAICVGLMTFLAPTRKARAYVAAARLLSDARNRYVNDPDYPLQKLLDAVQQGEDLISKADPI